jgi:exopolysaccharide production protein ExoZ
MRAVAALLVLVYHVGREIDWQDPSAGAVFLPLAGVCDFGVDFFFVISGFVMVYVTAGRPGGARAARDFFGRRLIRIAPMYWIATLLFILPVLIAPQTLHRRGYSLAYILASFGFVPWQRPDDVIPSISPIFGLGWTLNYEMAFYICFAAMIALRVRRPEIALAVSFAVLGAIGFLVAPFDAQIYFYTRTLLLEFVFGAVIATQFLKGRRIEAGAGIAMIFVGIAIWLAAGWYLPVRDGTVNIRGLSWGAAAALLVGGVSLAPAIGGRFERRGLRILQQLGDASYSLYLSHLFVLRSVSILFARAGIGMAYPYLFLSIVAFLACAVAFLLHRSVEKTILSFAHRALGRQGELRRVSSRDGE